MIEGINVRCNVGVFEVTRSPHIKVSYRRRAVVSRAEVDIADADGAIRASLAKGDAVAVRFGYRGGANLWHEWAGAIDGFDQAGQDTVRVAAVGGEQALLNTKVTESYYGEPASVVARRLLAATGFAVHELAIPDETLPHMIFSGVSVAAAIRQLTETLSRSFGHDMSKHALWLGENGLCWSDADEPGDVIRVATAENLISHTPAEGPGGLARVESALLPGLTHSRKFHLYDTRHAIDAEFKALEVEHLLEQGSSKTTILYGVERGWG